MIYEDGGLHLSEVLRKRHLTSWYIQSMLDSTEHIIYNVVTLCAADMKL